MMPHVEVYEDKGGGWRWRRVSSNGRIVADSGESYTRKFDAEEAAERENKSLYVMVPRPDAEPQEPNTG